MADSNPGTRVKRAKRFPSPSRSGLLWAAALLVALQAGEAGAQAKSPTDGFISLAMTPGAPSGSFALSGFENVNLFNGNLSRAEGGALVLNEAEHMLTRTFAGRGRVVAGQEAGMAFRDVLARDIRTFEV